MAAGGADLHSSDALLNAFHRQGAADDTGGRDHHQVWVADPQPGRRELCHALRIMESSLAIRAIGVAAIDDDSLSATAGGCEVLFAELNGVGGSFTGRESSCGSTGYSRNQERQIRHPR